MKVLKIIHGYPPRYNAGSEVYSQMLCQALAKHHDICVFTRDENPFLPDFAVHEGYDNDDPRIKLYVVNLLPDRYRFRYRHEVCDAKLSQILEHFQPDIVHIGHLNHLSTSLIDKIQQCRIPIVFTLHDYWLMCPRGQFIQRIGKTSDALWPLCDGQAHRKCAEHCYIGATSGNKDCLEKELHYWEDWIAKRMEHIQDIVTKIDLFIAPSRYLQQRFIKDFGLPEDKIIYLDYGFDRKRFTTPRKRATSETFTFGYIGTHIPAKGIQDLIQAFRLIQGTCQLRIWGRETLNTAGLKALIKTLPPVKQAAIHWQGEYCNNTIINDVFNHVDAIVVPSIWVENSPLVIHEALQARVLVITADLGGMAEYIKHEVNGLLFKHRTYTHLAQQMQRCLDEPQFIKRIAQRGYLATATGDVIDMETHCQQIEKYYQQLIAARSITHD